MSRREIDLEQLSVVAPVADEQERRAEVSLRPGTLHDFVGQRELVRHLEIVLGSARSRGQGVDHLLFAGNSSLPGGPPVIEALAHLLFKRRPGGGHEAG